MGTKQPTTQSGPSRERIGLVWKLRHVLTLAAVAAATALQVKLTSWFGPGLPPFLTLGPVVLLVAILGGLIPGLLATLEAGVMSACWIFPSGHLFLGGSRGDQILWAGFLCLGVLTSLFANCYRSHQVKSAAFDRDSARREETESYHTLINQAPDGIAVHVGGKIVFVNPAAVSLFGATGPADLVGRELHALVHPEDRESTTTRIRQVVMENVVSPSKPTRLLRLDGRPVAVETTAAKIQFKGQSAVQVVLRDLTARKRMETALIDSRERFALAALASQDGLWDWNILTGETFISNRLWELLGLEPDEVSHQEATWRELVHPEDWSELTRTIAVHLERRTPCHGDFRIRTKPGDHRWFHLRGQALWNDQGRPYRLAGSLEDITQRKESEQEIRRLNESLEKIVQERTVALSASEERFRMMVESVQDYVIIMLAPDGCVVTWNEGAAQIIGYEAREILGQPHSVFFSLADRAQDQPARELATAERCGRYKGEGTRVRKDGSHFQASVVTTALRDEGGGLRGFAKIMRDITARARADEALRASQARFESFASATFEGIVESEDGCILDCNEQCARLLGYSPTELRGMSIASLIAPADVVPVMANIQAGRDTVIEHGMVRKDGTIVIVEAHGRPISPGQSRRQTSIRDITERRRAEGDLKLFRALIDRSNNSLFILDFATARLLDANENACRELGYARPELLALGLPEIVPAIDLGDFVRHGTSLKENGRLLLELQFRRRDGTGFLGEVNLSLVTVDRDYVVAICQDVTERKRAEETQTRLATIVEQASDSILITDPEGTIIYANPAFEKISGYSRAELLGQSPAIVKSGQHPPDFYQDLWATLKSGRRWQGHFINRRKDGTLFREEATISPVLDHAGQIINFVSVKRDVTRETQLEEQLRQAQKLDAIGTLAGGIAHDFNNILTAMLGYAHLLREHTAGNATAQEHLNEILLATHRAGDLVSQILTFSRQHEQKRTVIRAETVIREAAKFLRASLPAQININIHLAPDAPPILADPTQIYQVLINLSTNALHAMEGKAGTLTILLEAFTPDAEFLSANPQFGSHPYARLSISDTGCGMDAKTLDRIFEPFFTTKPVGKGTGLGLAVVHGIVHSHEAIMTVASAPGLGSAFRLYFAAQTLAEEATQAAEEAAPEGRGRRLLILDDEIPLTFMMRQSFERLHYEVDTSNRPGDAVRLFEQAPEKFDLVITDLTMPEMNGLEFARKLQAIRPGVPIVLATGFAPQLTPEVLREAGVSELIYKPFAPADLAWLVHRLIAAG